MLDQKIDQLSKEKDTSYKQYKFYQTTYNLRAKF